MASAVLDEASAPVAVGPVGNDVLYEIVNGRHVELPPMSVYATWIASRLHTRLDVHAANQALGTVVSEMLFVLDSVRDVRRRPDVAFVSVERWPWDRELPESGDWDVIPDLAVEVVSPSDEFSEVVAKVRQYFHYGVRLVWVIVPEERQVYVYDSPARIRILEVADTLTGGDLLPGLALSVQSLFARSDEPTAPPALENGT
jgi:Uma2 family endonuclease